MNGKQRVLLGMAVALAVSVTPVRADIVSGACLLNIKVTFPSTGKLRMTAATNATSIEVTAGTCGATFQPVLDSIIGTQATLSIDAVSEWTCTDVHASGKWNQEWDNDPPPPVANADYTLIGATEAPTMVIIKGTVFVAAVQLVSLSFPLDAPACIGLGVSEITYTGVQVFQDP